MLYPAERKRPIRSYMFNMDDYEISQFLNMVFGAAASAFEKAKIERGCFNFYKEGLFPSSDWSILLYVSLWENPNFGYDNYPGTLAGFDLLLEENNDVWSAKFKTDTTAIVLKDLESYLREQNGSDSNVKEHNTYITAVKKLKKAKTALKKAANHINQHINQMEYM